MIKQTKKLSIAQVERIIEELKSISADLKAINEKGAQVLEKTKEIKKMEDETINKFKNEKQVK